MADGGLNRNPEPHLPRGLWPHDDLLRVLSTKKLLKDLHDAFMLRSGDRGLSVCFDCTPAECVAVLRLNSYGVASLKVGGVTALGLSVTPDEPHHASIEGLPHKEDDRVRAEWFASQLAAIATIVDTERREPPAI